MSKSVQEHLDHIRKVLDCLEDAGLRSVHLHKVRSSIRGILLHQKEYSPMIRRSRRLRSFRNLGQVKR